MRVYFGANKFKFNNLPFYSAIKRYNVSTVNLHVPGYYMRDVEIRNEPVELYKILKFEGMTASGGEAKLVIEQGQVLVNDVVETRKRKKIYSGDIIEFASEKICIKLTGKSNDQ